MSEIIEGWYWIKINDCPWEAAHWTGDGWDIVGSDDPLPHYENPVVGPRLLTPDDENRICNYNEVMTERGLAEVLSQTMSGELTVKLSNGDVESYMISEVEKIL